MNAVLWLKPVADGWGLNPAGAPEVRLPPASRPSTDPAL